jgi:hypothetical protein
MTLWTLPQSLGPGAGAGNAGRKAGGKPEGMTPQ